MRPCKDPTQSLMCPLGPFITEELIKSPALKGSGMKGFALQC